MKSFIFALVAIATTSSVGFAKEDMTTMSSYWGNSANEVAVNDARVLKAAPYSMPRLVHDQGQCARGEQLTPVWDSSSNNAQALVGYACETFFD